MNLEIVRKDGDPMLWFDYVFLGICAACIVAALYMVARAIIVVAELEDE